jgi:hypothetical protein
MTFARALARSGAILPTAAIGVAAYRRAAPRAGPIDHHVRLRSGGAHAHAEAGHGIVPYGELAAVGLEGINRSLGNSLRGHLVGSLCYPVGATPGKHRNGTPRKLRIAA